MTRVLLTAAAAAAIAWAAPAGATGSHGLTAHDRHVIRFFQHHPRAAATPAGGRILSRLLPRLVHDLDQARALQAARSAIPAGVCASCWDAVAACESGGGGPADWDIDTGNGFYWGLQWVPSTWDNAAAAHGLPTWQWFRDRGAAPTREQQIVAASGLDLGNWPVCGASY